ncbi:MAG: class I mannose-6-phosphate isomerase [Verrucomicrobiales bacterium]|nr:class I mannose-6-phosphate isomerase [Verrucomicrobiales bacterium]
MLYPLTFDPVLKARVWGGRALETVLGRNLPPNERVGESWEITDRPEGVSVIRNGPLAGRTLRWLMENHRDALLGDATHSQERFPLLVKLLDAQQALSVQVHPPVAQAAALGGEPKTEVWYVAHAEPGAELMAGISPGTTREGFARMVREGTAAEAVLRLPVATGDSLFLPSGRLHALGAGLIIFEIQQNSDTTYRVFDWNRVGPDGKPRELHLDQALASIDFTDTAPALASRDFQAAGAVEKRVLADCPWFRVEQWRLVEDSVSLQGARLPLVVAGIKGRFELALPGFGEPLVLKTGDFALVPAAIRDATSLQGSTGGTCLVAEPGLRSDA